MGLSISFEAVRTVQVFNSTTTHNLVPMAEAAGVYDCLWRPEECGVKTAEDLIVPLRRAIQEIRRDPARFSKLDAANGWGTREQFLAFLADVLAAAKDHPDATVSASR